ncbi:hypothetical protein PZA11_000534 [Diplocarpon coronariae]
MVVLPIFNWTEEMSVFFPFLPPEYAYLKNSFPRIALRHHPSINIVNFSCNQLSTIINSRPLLRMKFLLIVATIGLAAAQYEYAGYRPKQSKTRTPRATAVAEGPPNIAARSSLPVPWGTDRDQSSPWGRDQDGNPYEVRRDTEELSMNLFECTLGPQPKGNCCESFSTNNVGFNCDDATPLMANYVSKTVLFGCPAAPTTNNGSKQKTIGACCSSNVCDPISQ